MISIKDLNTALTSVMEGGEARDVEGVHIERRKHGRQNVLAATVGSETVQDTNINELAKAIVALTKEPEKSEDDEKSEPEHRPAPALTRAVVKELEAERKQREVADQTPAPGGRRIRNTALERELHNRLEEMTQQLQREFTATRSAETRYMRALYDLYLDGESIYEGLTLNETLMCAGAIVRAQEIEQIGTEDERVAA